MKHYDLVFFGVKTTTREIARHVINAGHKIDLIVSLTPTDKHHISGYLDLREFAKEIGADFYAIASYDLTDQQDRAFFAAHEFDMGISYGWQRLIPEYVLSTFKTGVFGFHACPEPLPKGKGRSPMNWALVLGHKQVHSHFFRYDPTADGGPIVSVRTFPITPHDTILMLQYKGLLGAKEQVVDLLEAKKVNAIPLRKQSGKSTYFPKRRPKDGKIDFAKSVDEVFNLIRAVTHPFPGAFCLKGEEQIMIWRAVPFEPPITASYQVGEVVDAMFDLPLVKCSDGYLLVQEYDGPCLQKGDVLK